MSDLVHKSPLNCASSGEIGFNCTFHHRHHKKGKFSTLVELFRMKRDLGVHLGEFVFSFCRMWDEQTATHIGAVTHGSGWSCNDHKNPNFDFDESQCTLGNSPRYCRRRMT